jgi:transcriptional regulator of arginine metabolism
MFMQSFRINIQGTVVKERQTRLKAVRRIIKNTRISSQEVLLEHLKLEGYAVTQATLSRDLKLLKVGKQAQGTSGYYYTLPTDDEWRETERSFIQDFQRGYVAIEFSGNMAVVRTLSGHADSVALALDNLGFDEIIGSVAGDDTVLAVLKQGIAGATLLARLRDKIPDLEE